MHRGKGGAAARAPDCLGITQGAGGQVDTSAAGRILRNARSDANCGGPVQNCLDAERRVWAYVQKLAAENNVPGVFTSFIGYEFSAGVRGETEASGHMHRNVIFGNDHVPDKAFSALDGARNTMLWKWLDSACTSPCDVIAIPHNSNLSLGYQFALETVDGTKYDDQDWRRKAQYERLVEIHQIKGNSECSIGFGTTDEECGFEQIIKERCAPNARSICITESSFVRNALKTGLTLGGQLGFNPFHFGFIGSTDTHSAVPGATSSASYPGSIGLADGTPARRLANPGTLGRNPGGLAGVWAEQNTRPSIFSAFKRRETFATSGSRIRVRLFGGWSLPKGLSSEPNWVAEAYKLGVPMGGDLPTAGKAGSPGFVVWAARDPDTAPLAKIQIVKGWRTANGADEAVYDVVCSSGAPDPKTHRCADNGSGVNTADCSVRGAGAETLAANWVDPDFDPARPAFYYARVIENPTCRWSTFDAIKLHQPPPPFVPAAVRERAWSSPIWYNSRADKLAGV